LALKADRAVSLAVRQQALNSLFYISGFAAPALFIIYIVLRETMRLIFKLIIKRPLQKLIAIIILDVLIFCNTNAHSVTSLILVLGFVMLLVTAYYLFYCVLAALRLYGIKVHHQKRFALSLSGVSGAFIGLQSVGELSSRDALVILPIGIILYFYSSYGVNTRGQML
jgi:hypothetical protein